MVWARNTIPSHLALSRRARAVLPHWWPKSWKQNRDLYVSQSSFPEDFSCLPCGEAFLFQLPFLLKEWVETISGDPPSLFPFPDQKTSISALRLPSSPCFWCLGTQNQQESIAHWAGLCCFEWGFLSAWTCKPEVAGPEGSPCGKMGTNGVILGQLQSYGGQELRADGIWRDLLINCSLLALQPVNLCVCFPSAYMGTRG